MKDQPLKKSALHTIYDTVYSKLGLEDVGHDETDSDNEDDRPAKTTARAEAIGVAPDMASEVAELKDCVARLERLLIASTSSPAGDDLAAAPDSTLPSVTTAVITGPKTNIEDGEGQTIGII